MGAGKTTIGRPVASALGRPFLDNDVLLERATGMSAAVLSERDGIDALHRAEAAIVIDALQCGEPVVVTAAASTITDAEVRAVLHERAWVGWLRADHATLTARLPESEERPFRSADADRLVADQAAARDALFAEVADGTFETGGTDADEVVKALLRALAAAGIHT
jgi:shikimate kinase/3-dehydroquinate synthase